MVNNNILWEKIVSFINDKNYNQGFFWEGKIIVNRETDIAKDLRITGDDAEDFIFDFLELFPFELNGFEISDYFEGEGFLSFFNKKKNLKKLTLGMLENAAINKRWEMKQ